ncbi:formate dehydrogenase subunit delta [Mycolicibacterium goodii]|uniref:Formate dehydrogenase n=1 Tax=Mycolicibacterium goodii TaxID=134601 RepID=A0A0K0X3B0_MYCGD|nr:formate dehydrogenase [Mycolicibacterium goodii]
MQVHEAPKKAANEIKLINQIAAHFGYLPDDKAAAAVADHVRRFWEPRMQRRLFDLIYADASELTPVAMAAASRLR